MSAVQIKNRKKWPQTEKAFLRPAGLSAHRLGIDFCVKKRATTEFVDNIINLASFVSLLGRDVSWAVGGTGELKFNVVWKFSSPSSPLAFCRLNVKSMLNQH